jgi:drug/metabolite transporter (DMT)-like permease
VNPVVAVTLGSLILGEPVSAGLLSGGAFILLAVLLTTARRPARASRSQPLVEAEEEAGCV